MAWRPVIIGACSVTAVAVLCLLQLFTLVKTHEVAENVDSFGQHQQLETLLEVETRSYFDR